MKKIRYLIITALLLCGCGTPAPEPRGIFVMDTYFSAAVYGGTDASENAFTLLEGLEQKLSVTDGSSDISRINAAKGVPTEVSAETAELISRTLDICEKTGGALDPTLYPVTREWGFTTSEYRVPGEQRLAELLCLTGYENVSVSEPFVTIPDGFMLDLGATAKGYALEKAAEVLREKGASSAVLNLGGNVRIIGDKPDGSLWRAAVVDPMSPSEILCAFDTGETALATSGGYERYFIGEDGRRYCHIIDPITGRPVDNGLASVTVISGDAFLCDALSTALFVMGEDGALRFWRENGGFELVIVREDGKVLYTEGLDGFRLAEGQERRLTEAVRR